MSTRVYLNSFLSALVIVMSLILMVDTEQNGSAVSGRLTDINPEEIKSIRIIRHESEDIHMRKFSDHWRITQPFQIRANPYRVNSILSLLHTQVASQIPSDPQVLVSSGLASPDITLQLDDMEFQFGNISPLDKRRYLKHFDTIFIIDDFLYPQLRQDIGFFVDTRLFEGSLKSTHITCRDSMGEILEQDGSDENIMAWEHLDAVSVSTVAPPLPELADVFISTELNDPITLTVFRDVDDLLVKFSDSELYYRLSDDPAVVLGFTQSGCVVQDA